MSSSLEKFICLAILPEMILNKYNFISQVQHQTSWCEIAGTFLASFLGAYHVLPCLTIILYLALSCDIKALTFILSHRGTLIFSGKSILLSFIFRVLPVHLICNVSHRECLSRVIFWAFGWPCRVNVCSEPFNSLNLRGTW